MEAYMNKEILERAIKGNDMCREKYNCSECPYHGLHYCHSILCRESRDLLKEQQEQIDKLIEESASNAEMAEGLKELLKEQEAVIHCIDCCYYHKPEYGFTFGYCTRRSSWYQVNEKDYCSLAKRKEGR